LSGGSKVKERLESLRQKLQERGLDAFLVSQPENRRYVSGFTGSAGYVVATPAEAFLLVDFRYTEQAGRQAPGFEVRRVTGRLEEDLPKLLPELGGRRWAFESAHVTVSLYEKVRPLFEQAGIVLEGLEGVVESIRAVKDEQEQEFLRRAIRLTDEAFAHFLAWVRPGVTELEAAWEIEKYIREHGGEELSFPTIVGGGPNGAMPHHETGDRPLQAGEPIVIDMGAVCGGYHADMTRTIVLGEPDERFWSIYSLVRTAQERAEAGIRAGASGVEVDRLAREVIANAGYGDNFGHGLGHGVGLATHEPLRLSALSTDTLPVGATLTVEPGIYLPGWGGVRIEDVVLVHEDHAEVLTGSTKEPIVKIRRRAKR
jgi:Xaa-Pro aminopeptidase